MENYTLGSSMVVIDRERENLTTWGIFLSSLLLSCGGFIAIVFDSIKKSKCSVIDCGCTKCTRDIDEV